MREAVIAVIGKRQGSPAVRARQAHSDIQGQVLTAPRLQIGVQQRGVNLLAL